MCTLLHWSQVCVQVSPGCVHTSAHSQGDQKAVIHLKVGTKRGAMMADHSNKTKRTSVKVKIEPCGLHNLGKNNATTLLCVDSGKDWPFLGRSGWLLGRQGTSCKSASPNIWNDYFKKRTMYNGSPWPHCRTPGMLIPIDCCPYHRSNF